MWQWCSVLSHLIIHSFIHSFNDSSIHFHSFTLPSCAIQLRIAVVSICIVQSCMEVDNTQFNRPNQFIYVHTESSSGHSTSAFSATKMEKYFRASAAVVTGQWPGLKLWLTDDRTYSCTGRPAARNLFHPLSSKWSRNGHGVGSALHFPDLRNEKEWIVGINTFWMTNSRYSAQFFS